MCLYMCVFDSSEYIKIYIASINMKAFYIALILFNELLGHKK